MVDELDFELGIQRVESVLERIESVLERIASRVEDVGSRVEDVGSRVQNVESVLERAQEEQNVTLTKIVDRLELVIDEDRTGELTELMRGEARMSDIRAGIDLDDEEDEGEQEAGA